STGARAMLSWSEDVGGRVSAASKEIDLNVAWIKRAAGAEFLSAAVCLPSGLASASSDPGGLCSGSGAGNLSAQIIVRYEYAKSPLIPRLGIPPCAGLALCLPVPAVLQAQAWVDLGISYPGEPEGS